jgi:hypothetical protein
MHHETNKRSTQSEIFIINSIFYQFDSSISFGVYFFKIIIIYHKIENKNATNATFSDLSSIDLLLNKSRKTNY